MIVRLATVAIAALALTATAAPAVAQAVPRSHTVALPDGIRPEGIESHGSRFWVGSLADGRIVTGDLVHPRGTSVLLAGASGRQLRGLAYDSRTHLLWAAGNVGTVAHVWAVDTRTGAIRRDAVVPGGVFLNDLIVTRDAVWVTDSGVERLTRIDLRDRSVTFLPLRGAWPGAQGGNSANGIRALDRTHVVLDHSTAGGLWAVDVRSGVAREIPVRGGPAITSGDGLERHKNTLWVVRGTNDTSVAQLRLRETCGTWTARWVKLLTDPTLDVPSTATYTKHALWAVNARFGVASPETASYSITRL